MDVQDKGRERRGMYQVMVNGVAEAVHHSRSDQKRHEEIKVLMPIVRALGRHLIRQRVRLSAHFCRPIIAQPFEWLRPGAPSQMAQPKSATSGWSAKLPLQD